MRGGGGLNALYDSDRGIFTVNLSESDIVDLDGTNIKSALHLEGVNEGYTSNQLQIQTSEVVWDPAKTTTKLSELGVSAGTITVRANDANYNYTINNNTTLGQFITALQTDGVEASLNEGIFTLNNAEITNEGTTNIKTAFGLTEEISTKSQKSGALSYETTVVTATVAKGSTLLKDLGAGTAIANGDTVIVQNASGENKTINLNANSTVNDLLQGMNNAGLNASINEDGIVEIAGGKIVGGSFDAKTAFKLNEDPYTGEVTGDALTETIIEYELVTLQTRLHEDLMVKEGFLEVTDSEGEIRYLEINAGDTIQNLMSKLSHMGIYATLDESTGILEITGGEFRTMTNAEVQAAAAAGKADMQGAVAPLQATDLLELLYGAPAITAEQTEVAATSARSMKLTRAVVVDIIANENTTMSDLGVNSAQTIILRDRNNANDLEIAVNANTTLGSLINTINNSGNGVTASLENGVLKLENGYLENSVIEEALGLEREITGLSHVLGHSMTYTTTTTISGDATLGNIIGTLGTTAQVASGYNLYYNSRTVAVNANTTLDGLISTLNRMGADVFIDGQGALHVNNGTLTGTVANALGFESVSQTIAVGANGETLTTIETVFADTTTKLSQLNLGSSTITVKGLDGVAVGTITTNADMTLGDIFTALAGYGISGTITNGIITLNSEGDNYATGGVLASMGISTTNSTYNTTIGTTNSSSAAVNENIIIYASMNATVKDFKTGSISVKDLNGDTRTTIEIGTNSTTTFKGLFDELAKVGIQASIDDGVITLTSNDGSYVEGTLATAFGISKHSANSVVTVTTGMTSTGDKVQYKTEIYTTTFPTITQTIYSTGVIVVTEVIEGTQTLNIKDTYTYDDVQLSTRTETVSATYTIKAEDIGSSGKVTITHTHTCTEVTNVGTDTKTLTVWVTETIANTQTVEAQVLTLSKTVTTPYTATETYDVTVGASVTGNAISIAQNNTNTVTIPKSLTSTAVISVTKAVTTTSTVVATMSSRLADFYSISSSTTITCEAGTFTAGDVAQAKMGTSSNAIYISFQHLSDYIKDTLGADSGGFTITSDGTVKPNNTGNVWLLVSGETLYQGYTYLKAANRTTSTTTVTTSATATTTFGEMGYNYSADLQFTVKDYSGNIITTITLTGTKSANVGILNTALGSYGSASISNGKVTITPADGYAFEFSGSTSASVFCSRLHFGSYVGAYNFYTTTVTSTTTYTDMNEDTKLVDAIHNYGADGRLFCSVMSNGTEYAITFGNSTTMGEIIDQLEDKGFTAYISDGKLTIIGKENVYVSAYTSAVTTKLGFAEVLGTYFYNVETKTNEVSGNVTATVEMTTTIPAYTKLLGYTTNTVTRTTTVVVPKITTATVTHTVVTTHTVTSTGTHNITISVSDTFVLQTITTSTSTGTVEYTTTVDSVTLSPRTITVYGTGTIETTTWRTTSTTHTLDTDGSTKLSQMKDNALSSDGTVEGYYNGKAFTVTVNKDDTVNDMLTALAGYGISGDIAGGVIKLKGTYDGYITKMSDNLMKALGFAAADFGENKSWTKIVETTTHNCNTTSNIQTIGSTRTMTTDSVFSAMQLTVAGTMTVVSDGIVHTVNVETTDTVDDLLTTLAGLGIKGYVEGGKITLQGDSQAFIKAVSDALKTVLKLGNTNYTTATHTVYENTSSTVQKETTTATATGSTALSALRNPERNGTAGYDFVLSTWSDAGNQTVTLNFAAANTVHDVIDELANYGLVGAIDSAGRFSVTSSTLSDFAISGNLGNFLMDGASVFYDEVVTNNTSDILAQTVTTAMTDATTLKDLGISTGNIKLYQNGETYTIAVSENDTLAQFREKLAAYGVDSEIVEGKLSLTDEGVVWLADGTSNLVSKMELTHDKWSLGGYYQESDQLGDTQDEDHVVNGDTKLVDLQNSGGTLLGITTGEYIVYQNGVRTTETITNDTTVNDFISTLGTYGMIANLNQSGNLEIGAYNNTFLGTSGATGYATTNAIDILFEEWDFTNIYTSNNLDIPQDVTVAISRTTKLDDINDVNYQEGLITVVKDGVEHTVSFTADDTVGTFIDTLALYGFDTVINDDGQLTIRSAGDTIIKNYTGAAGTASNVLDILGVEAGDWVSTNIYGGKALDVITEDTFFTAADRGTKLSDLQLPVTTGEYYIYNNGVRYTALVSSDETVGSFLDTLASFGIQANLVSNGAATVLEITGNGDSYITKSSSTANASNIVNVLFPNVNNETTYNYEGDLKTSRTVISYENATENTLLSDIFTAWGDATLKAQGDLSVTVDGQKHVLSVASDETFGSLIEKLKVLGVEATLINGELMIQSGFAEFEINEAETTSGIIDDFGLQFHDDLGGYLQSSGEVISTVSWEEVVDESVSKWADYDTKLSQLNISSGTLSVYKNGQKATIEVKSDETFGDLRARIALAHTGVDIAFENGYLKFYSTAGDSVEVGATTDTSNIMAICGLSNDKSGTVVSGRELYRVNGTSKIMDTDLFRRENVTEGTFIVGDAEFTIDSNTTINDIISQINASEGANATATWDSIDGKLVIKSRTTGSALINVEAGTSNFTDVMGLTNTERNPDNSIVATRIDVESQEIGENASFSINGTHFNSTSNTVGSDLTRIKGVTINLKDVTEGETVTLTVERDKETVANAVSDVVDAYNELIENVDKEVARGAQLADQSTLKLIRNQIRSLMTSSLSGISVFKNLDQIGIVSEAASAANIATENVNVLYFDKDKFLKAFDADRDALKNLLVGTETNLGIFSRIENVVESALAGASGYFASADKSYNTQISRLDNKIEKAQKAVDRYRARLEAKFSAMDQLIANIQNQYSTFLM